MTNRARWILAITVCGMLLGMLFRITHFAILNLIFIFWIGIEWIAFRYKSIRANELFSTIRRTIDDSPADNMTLSLHQDYEVVLEAVFNRNLHGLRFFVTDLVPQGIESNDRWPAVVDLQLQPQVKWKYRIKPMVTGQLAFTGLQITVTDKYGFFREQRFIPLHQNLTLLPFVMQPKTTAEKVKRDNVHLMSGHHRFRKAGISSELLGIREYQKGDPPRSIAWKATARVGKLMTCEYESEVPIGATVLADVSGYQFWGRPGPAPFDAISSVVASITRLLTEDKDPVGVVLASGKNRARVRPGLGQRQLIRVLEALMKSAPGSTTANDYEIRDLEEFIWRSIYRINPELVSDKINHAKVPWLMYGPRRRYHFSVRRQSATALNWLLGGPIGDGFRLTYDDEYYRQRSNDLFSKYPALVNEAPLVADFGAGRIEKEDAVLSLCQGLVECVARSHDNELFIMVGDFNVRSFVFRELINAIRVARARYHRVMVISIPGTNVADNIRDDTAKQAFDYIQSHNASTEIRHFAAIQQLGASVALLDDVSLLEQVIGEIQILKTGGSRGPALSSRAEGV